MNKVILLTGLLFLMGSHSLFACGEKKQQAAGTLKTKNHTVSISNANNGPLYTVKTNEGMLLAANLTSNDLAKKFPSISNLIERGIADDASVTNIQNKDNSGLGLNFDSTEL